MKSMSLLILTLLAMVSGSSACNGVCSCDYTGAIMDCSNRGLTEPPSGLYRRVTRLDLTGNQISVVDKNSFSAFPSVSSLSLKENQLTEVHLEGLAFMSQLTELHLEDNRIQRLIPAPASRFGSLYHVFLDNNSLASLDPDTFLNAPKLQLLFLNYNPIVVPRGQAIVNNPSMEYLHMRYGSSLDLGPESFAGLPLLREVVVFSAGITSIHGAFVNNTRLSNIVLYNNLITEVTEGSFYSGNIIRGLLLSYNPLERLDVAALENALAPGANLDIEDTPLACSCNYESLYWWTQANGINLSATCGGSNKCSFSQKVDV